MKTIIQDLGELYQNHIWMKREDLIPFSFGGNKARKADLFFREIDKGNYDCVVTYGSSSSNHCRVVSNLCRQRTMSCYIIGPQERSEETFNKQMMELFGAEVTEVPVKEVHDAIEKKLACLKQKGKRPYFIEGGGHGNIGTEAYVHCYREIREFEVQAGIYFDYIFFASGTGTTQAGLVCGQLMDRRDDKKIIGISIARSNPRGRRVILDSITQYLTEKQIDVSAELIVEKTIFIDNYISGGYSYNNLEIKKNICEMLMLYGIPLDSTYTGKAYTGMKKYIQERKIEEKNILFIHTGGTPLFFDDLKKR